VSDGLTLWGLQQQAVPQGALNAGPGPNASAQTLAAEAAASTQGGGLQGLQDAATAPLNDAGGVGAQGQPSRPDASAAADSAQRAMVAPTDLTDLLSDMQRQASVTTFLREATPTDTQALPDAAAADLPAESKAGLQLQPGAATLGAPSATPAELAARGVQGADKNSGGQTAANGLSAEVPSPTAAQAGTQPEALLAAGQAPREPTGEASGPMEVARGVESALAVGSVGQAKDTAGLGDGRDAAQQRSALRAYQTASLGAPLDIRDVARPSAAAAVPTAVGDTPAAASAASGADEVSSTPTSISPSVAPQVNLAATEAVRTTSELRGGGTTDAVPHQSVEFEQLPGHLAAKIALGEGRLQLQVTPPQFGTLDLDVRLQDGALFVSLRAESAAVVQHLERHLQDLGAQLEGAGLTLGGMDLSARDAPGDAQAGSGAFGTAGTPAGSFARSRGSRGPAPHSLSSHSPDAAEPHSPRRLGGLDVIA
jgi:hypothetical protein